MRVRKKILIIDDEAGICELLSEQLRHHGYETSTATGGLKGLAEIERFEPDLILLDIMMPNMDGWEVLTKLRAQEKTKDIPVVMLTGTSDTDELLKSVKHKVADYFIKPVNIDELLAFIKRYENLNS
jgi:DNA-binding response OmpR family regulator